MKVYIARVTIQNPLIAEVPYPIYATISAESEQSAKEKFIAHLLETYGKSREVHVDLRSLVVYPHIQ